MGKVLRNWRLNNGILLEAEDESINYGEYWRIKLVVKGEVEVKEEYLPHVKEEPLGQEALRELGERVQYRRELSRMGVPQGEIARVKEELLSSFEENSLPYLSNLSFPERFVRKCWREKMEEIRKRRLKDESDI